MTNLLKLLSNVFAGEVKGDHYLVQMKKNGEERFGCVSCGRAYKHKKHLKTHQHYECGKEPQFQCPSCPWRAKVRSSLKRHLATQHNQFYHA